MADHSAPKKIAILGGGVGAMAAAFGLTEKPGWQDEYEITIYQMGWRLGGKGASGRNPYAYNRIEEHGLHIWAGFYENAFRIMRKCYDELGRSPEAPLATWQDAFKPHSYSTIEERMGESYTFWNTELPTNDGVPGDGGEFPSLWDYVCMMIESMINMFKSHPLITQADAEPHHHILPELLHSIVEECEHRLSNEGEKLGLFARLRFHPGPAAGPAGASSLPAPIENQAVASGPDSSGNPRMRLLEAALKTASSLPADPAEHPASHHKAVLWMLEEFMAWFKGRVEGEIEEHAELRHTYLRTDLIMAITRGIIGDELIFKGLDSIDGEEWSDWLRRHGASEFTLSSPLVRGLYDYAFAYLDGDTGRRASAAATNLYGLFRLMCTYKGAFFYKMQAGMGDTVFGPLYEVLKRRGVRFKFFHRVLSLGLSEDKNSIAEIRISRQVNLKGGDYYPLFDVKGLPCWPSVPLYDQIVEGEELKSRKIDLESAWTPWKDTGGEVILKRGDDFDLVVLGISLGALNDICAELIAARQEWRDMVVNIKTTQTQAMQLWLKPDAAGLGWPYLPALVSVYSEPINTWADMSHLLPREGWAQADAPQNIAYFCGLLEDTDEIAPYSDSQFPQTQLDRVKRMLVEFLNSMASSFWPDAVDAQGNFKWDLLAGAEDGAGAEALDSQYLRANINPTERYVLSVPGSSQYRLSSDASGFSNLYLAGDWVRTAINAGCVEAATMAGLQASRAICGYPKEIIGDKRI